MGISYLNWKEVVRPWPNICKNRFPIRDTHKNAMEINSTLFNTSKSCNSSLQNNFGEEFCQGDIASKQELYYTVVICVLNILLCPMALFGNFATLTAIWKTTALHSPANTLLSSLALSDFAVGLIVHPIFIARLSRQISDNWKPFHNLFLTFNIISTFLCSTSFFTVTAIAIDRLLALQLHLRYQSLVTQYRVCLAVIFIWVFSALFSSLQLWFTYLYAILLSPILVTLLVTNFAAYFRIYLIVRRHQTQIQQQQGANSANISNIKSFKKSAFNTFLVYILLLCCYTPFVAIISFKGWHVPSSVLNASGTIILLNSSLNPLLYCWRVREFRSAMKRIFCC